MFIMEQTIKFDNVLFRPWASSEQRIHSTESTSRVQVKNDKYHSNFNNNSSINNEIVFANNKFGTTNCNRTITSFNMPSLRQGPPISSNSQVDLFSLLNHHHSASSVVCQSGSKMCQVSIEEAPRKSKFSALPVSDTKSSYHNHHHHFPALAPPPNMFSIPNLFAYNFPTNLSTSSLFAPNACFDNLIANKTPFTTNAADTLSLPQQEKVIEQQHLTDRQPKKQRPKRFQCPHCQVSFSNNGQLKGHVRIHTGERPFACDHVNCGKTFTRNEELTRHKRIHTGLRPFACSICNKRFGRKDHLKKHVKTHQRPTPLTMPLPLDPAFSYAALAYSWL